MLPRRRRLAWRLAGTCAVMLAACAPGLPALAKDKPPVPATELADNELLLLEVTLDRHVLSHDLSAYQHGKGVYVPLGELARLLGFAVDVDPDAGTAKGFVLQESRAFKLNAHTGEAIADGKRAACDPAQVVVRDDDIYVEAGLLTQWFPVKLDLDPYAAQVDILPREVLPLQEFLEREARGKKGGPTAAAALPRLDQPYRLWDWPTLDQGMVMTMRTDDAGRPVPSMRYNTYATGELLFMSSDLFMTGSDQSPFADVRASLGRKDPDASLLGPLRATEASVGQLAMPGLALLARPQPGLGVMVGNFPLNQPTQFDHHTFQGNLPPGWDVELYRGDQLLAHQSSRGDGRYQFEDVPLLMGLNNFRLVFYGPQGQRREETYPFNVGASLSPVGTGRYRATASVQADGAPASYAQVDYGLLPQLTASVGLATLSDTGVRTNAARLGLRSFLGACFLTGDVGASTDGLLAQVGAQTSIGPMNVTLTHARSTGFTSQAFAGGSSVNSHSEGRLDWPGLSVAGASVSTGVQLSFDELRDGGGLGRFSLPVTAAYHGLYAAHRMNFTAGAGANTFFSDAALQLSGRWGVWGLRGDVGYDGAGLRSLGMVASARRWLWDYNMNASVSHALASGDTSFLVNVSKDLGVALMGMDAGSQYLSMSASTAVGLDPATGAIAPRSMPQAGSGTVLARVFLDLNRNGHWDADEPPVEGAGVGTDSGDPKLTNAQGLVVLRNLASYLPLDLSLAPDTLTDPLWSPAGPGVRVVPRPGRNLTIDFPIFVSGEVNGTIYLKRRGKATELGGATLELVGPDGKVAAHTRTAYDGFYTFTLVPPGAYTLRVPNEQFTKRPLAHDYAKAIAIAPGGTLLEGLDFTLELAHDDAPIAKPKASNRPYGPVQLPQRKPGARR